MKSLILKDLYNIGHNMKSMLLVLVVLAVGLISSAGTESYVVASGIICGTMVITTFSFDNMSKWSRYAMIMPVSRKDLVASKFIVLLIFCGWRRCCRPCAGDRRRRPASQTCVEYRGNPDFVAVKSDWFPVYGNLWKYFDTPGIQVRRRTCAYVDACLVYRPECNFLRYI